MTVSPQASVTLCFYQKPPGERRAFLGESSSGRLEEGPTLSGTPASFVCCLFSRTQMVHFEEAGCRFHPCMRAFFHALPRRHVLSQFALSFISLLRFFNATWNDVSRRNLHFLRTLQNALLACWFCTKLGFSKLTIGWSINPDITVNRSFLRRELYTKINIKRDGML